MKKKPRMYVVARRPRTNQLNKEPLTLEAWERGNPGMGWAEVEGTPQQYVGPGKEVWAFAKQSGTSITLSLKWNSFPGRKSRGEGSNRPGTGKPGGRREATGVSARKKHGLAFGYKEKGKKKEKSHSGVRPVTERGYIERVGLETKEYFVRQNRGKSP